MARPRLVLDEEKIREMLRRECGSRRIARELGVSRSLIQRALAGTRFASAPRRAAMAAPKSARDASDRSHAHAMLVIGRGQATDDEFAAAVKRLDGLLDGRPESRGYTLTCEVQRELAALVGKREDAARRAKEERERAERRAEDERETWMKTAAADAADRWNSEIRLAARGLSDLKYFDRQKIESVLDEEKQRVVTLVGRRMKEMKTGAITEGLVDRIVEEGLSRVDPALKKVR